jgi:hypothetical protein
MRRGSHNQDHSRRQLKPLHERISLRVRVDHVSGCWQWQGAHNAAGYGFVKRGRKSEGQELVHRAMFELVNGYLPPVVRHTCDNPPCCNPAHLEPGNHLDNMRDRAARNRTARGARVHNRRMRVTPEIAREIRTLTHLSGAEIGALYGISRNYANQIRAGSRWADA